jgi:hypothetical protein
MPTVAEQEYYLKSQLANDEYRNNLAAKAAAQLNAQLTYENQLEMARRTGVGGNAPGPGRDWMLAPKSAGGGGYDPGYGGGSGIDEGWHGGVMAPTYKKISRNNLNKTTKQIRAAIYTPKKSKDLTKSQKIVIAEMFGKQIVTKPTKKQKTPR